MPYLYVYIYSCVLEKPFFLVMRKYANFRIDSGFGDSGSGFGSGFPTGFRVCPDFIILGLWDLGWAIGVEGF